MTTKILSLVLAIGLFAGCGAPPPGAEGAEQPLRNLGYNGCHVDKSIFHGDQCKPGPSWGSMDCTTSDGTVYYCSINSDSCISSNCV